jgi:hypothetical protein
LKPISGELPTTCAPTEGPAQEVYFGQKHTPGRLCASDFTHMTKLGITLAGRTCEYLVYHFVLTYSNWKTGTICYSESLESLSEGWQNNEGRRHATAYWAARFLIVADQPKRLKIARPSPKSQV